MHTFLLSLLVWISALAVPGLTAAPLAYQLQARQIAADTWLVEGAREDFSRENGGNIVNVAFIRTTAGVVLIDTGPSKRYGEALQTLIFETTGETVREVFLTHHHPDHVFGNQAFGSARIWGTQGLTDRLAADGESFSDNMYRLVGDWMRGTEVVLPTHILSAQRMTIGNHRFRFYRFTGHTGDDLVVLDETTGVLFVGDMLFYQRALTTPHSPGLMTWHAELEQVRRIGHALTVPGHGPVTEDMEALEQTQAYLRWLDQTFAQAALDGLTMNELMGLPVPARFESVRMTRYELIRTVSHLYPHYEAQVLLADP